MKRVNFYTLGCKVNQYETNAMIQKFQEAGYEVVNDIADIYIVNTCTVTNIADRKSRQMLRRVKENNKNAILVATGCYAQVGKNELNRIENENSNRANRQLQLNIMKYHQQSHWLDNFRNASLKYSQALNNNNLVLICSISLLPSNPIES